ncbi:MAG: DoxX family membrane protein [Cyclobacteriaceae bacterium]
MIFSKVNNKTLAVNLLRISFGINYLFHGLVRLPDLNGFVSGMEKTFESTMIPGIAVTLIAYAIPIVETIIGVMLLANKLTRETLLITFFLMNTLMIGCCFAGKWDVVGLQMTYIGFLFLLLYFTDDQKA